MKQTSWSLFRFRDSYFTAYGKKPCQTGISSPYMQQINMIDPLYTANHQVSSVGGFNPFEKYYSSQIGSFPQAGVKIRKYLKPPPSYVLKLSKETCWPEEPQPELWNILHPSTSAIRKARLSTSTLECYRSPRFGTCLNNRLQWIVKRWKRGPFVKNTQTIYYSNPLLQGFGNLW